MSKHEFRDELLDKDTGLGVIICSYKSGRFVILNDAKLDICQFLEVLHGREAEDSEPAESGLSAENLSRALASMESEYDRWVAKLLVCTGKSRLEIYDLGFKPDRVVKLLRELKERFCAWENSNVAARDMVELRLKEKKVKLERKIGEIEKTMELVRGKWTDARVGDLEEQTIALKESLESTVATLERRSKQDEQRFNQAAKRTARRLVAEQRITKRRLGSGRKQELDSEDEEWLVKCIEDKATIHGRRHESVLYTHHRVKCRDLLNIANYRRLKQGKRLLKSVSSITTRARATNKRSRQAKRHLGKGLWCSKKPPKTEDRGNECTHHQRKQVQLAKEEFFLAEMPMGASVSAWMIRHTCVQKHPRELKEPGSKLFCSRQMRPELDPYQYMIFPRHQCTLPHLRLGSSAKRQKWLKKRLHWSPKRMTVLWLSNLKLTCRLMHQLGHPTACVLGGRSQVSTNRKSCIGTGNTRRNFVAYVLECMTVRSITWIRQQRLTFCL